MKTIDQLETEYQNAWEAYNAALDEYHNGGSEVKLLAARAACIDAGVACIDAANALNKSARV